MTRMLVAIAAVALMACGRGETYDAGGTVVDTVDTSRGLNLPDVDVGMKRDTITVPVIRTEKDTIIVDKPVGAGRKQVEIKRPTVEVHRKP